MDTYYVTIVYRIAPDDTASAVFEWLHPARNATEAATWAGVELGVSLANGRRVSDPSTIEIRQTAVERVR